MKTKIEGHKTFFKEDGYLFYQLVLIPTITFVRSVGTLRNHITKHLIVHFEFLFWSLSITWTTLEYKDKMK